MRLRVEWVLAALALAGALWASFSYYNRHGSAGEQLYRLHCANCHGDQGEGLNQLIPALVSSKVIADSVHRLPCLIRHGRPDAISAMPANHALSLPELTQLIHFLQQTWGEGQRMPANEIEQLLKQCDTIALQ